jgi:hypothetical protein
MAGGMPDPWKATLSSSGVATLCCPNCSVELICGFNLLNSVHPMVQKPAEVVAKVPSDETDQDSETDQASGTEIYPPPPGGTCLYRPPGGGG